MAKTVNIHEAKTNFSRLLAKVAAGEDVVIAKAGKPVAKLVAYSESAGQRVPGTAADLIEINDNFDEPLPPELAEAFGVTK